MDPPCAEKRLPDPSRPSGDRSDPRLAPKERVDALHRFQSDRRQGCGAGIQKIVDGWPKETRSARAAALGMQSQPDVDGLIREFIEDELEGK